MTATMLRGYHDRSARLDLRTMAPRYHTETKTTYTFQNHFHPYVAELVERLNRGSVDGLLALDAQRLHQHFFQALYHPNPDHAQTVEVRYGPREIDLAEDGPYAVYNWELFFHLPVAVARHLSQAQRHAEAMKWFHYVFDPTCNDPVPQGQHSAWQFRLFRDAPRAQQVDEMLRILAKPPQQCTPAEQAVQQSVLRSLQAVQVNPFHPHVVARHRFGAYQLWVFMAYLDNLIAWGDMLFARDTREAQDEATQLYYLAADLLGPRPQVVPPSGKVGPKSYRDLRAQGMDAMGNALVEMEAQFPFNFIVPPPPTPNGHAAPLLGIGRSLYFAIPPNPKLLAYWDTVADRLYKIHNSLNLAGVFRSLALFAPPIDPAALVKAAAAGIDVASAVAGLGGPPSSLRAEALLHRALELCGEVRALGNALLSAIEKHEGEQLALLRQTNELTLLERAQDVRFLQSREARASTEALLGSRAAALERFNYYRMLLGQTGSDPAAPDTLVLDRKALTEEGFDALYQELVEKYAKEAALAPYPQLQLAEPGPQVQPGGLALTTAEDRELNVEMPAAREKQESATAKNQIASILGLLPNLGVDVEPMGIGCHIEFGGPALSAVARIWAAIDSAHADGHTYAATRAGRIAGYQRRALEWTNAVRAAARDLAQIGRQLVSSLIREAITQHEYESHKVQIEQSRQVNDFMQGKLAGEELYGWMRGELSKLYYEYYRHALAMARRAEQAVKYELMRPEFDETSFIRADAWEAGYAGMLAGDRLHLSLKRLQAAYDDANTRELELTRRFSVRQVNPLALLAMRDTGKCEVSFDEALFDIDAPGHYLRRVRDVSVTIPAVTGPDTPVSCTVTLLRSTLRRTPGGASYPRDLTAGDPRFVDYFGLVKQVVTSTGVDDAGLFEPGARDERYRTFEGAGAVSTWRLELPEKFRQFDYAFIPDVVITIRYTARYGGDAFRTLAVTNLESVLETEPVAGLALLLDLRHDFPTEWQRFTATPGANLEVTLRREHFPYLAQWRGIVLQAFEFHAAATPPALSIIPATQEQTDALTSPGEFVLSLPRADVTSGGDRGFLLIRYSIGG